MVKAIKAKNLCHVKTSLEKRNHIIVNTPPDAAPYKADTTEMDRIFKNGILALRNKGRSFMCIQLQPPQTTNEVRIKKPWETINNVVEYFS